MILTPLMILTLRCEVAKFFIVARKGLAIVVAVEMTKHNCEPLASNKT